MKRMILVAMAASLLAMPAMAQSASPAPAAPASVDVSGLSAAQIAQITADVEAQRASTPVSRAQEVNEWVNIGSGIGSGLAAAARETGQVVNEFAATPVGQLTVFVILFKVMGGDLIQLLVGLLFFGTMIPIWLHLYRKMLPLKITTVYDEATRQRTTTKEPAYTYDSGDAVGISVLAYVGLMAIIAVGLTVIFA